MWFKKLTSSLLITSLVTSQMVVAAYAGEPTPAKSPEFTFLKSVIAFQGTSLTKEQYQNKVQTAATTYVAAARAEGHLELQPERMEGALIALGIYSTDQAKAFTANTQATVTLVQNENPVTTQQLTQLVSREAIQLAGLHSTGAEFSATTCAAISLGVLGAFAAFIGVILVVTGGNDSFSSQDHPIAADVDIGLLSAAGVGAVIGAIGCL